LALGFISFRKKVNSLEVIKIDAGQISGALIATGDVYAFNGIPHQIDQGAKVFVRFAHKVPGTGEYSMPHFIQGGFFCLWLFQIRSPAMATSRS
jgi:hypothetical protein